MSEGDKGDGDQIPRGSRSGCRSSKGYCRADEKCSLRSCFGLRLEDNYNIGGMIETDWKMFRLFEDVGLEMGEITG
jgi:hypothetical protein